MWCSAEGITNKGSNALITMIHVHTNTASSFPNSPAELTPSTSVILGEKMA